MDNFLSRVKAVVLGHALADAIGVPVEFKSRYELEHSPVRDMTGYGTYNKPKGTWSDDTSMSLATIDSLSNGIDYDDMMKRFCDWLYGAKYTAGDVVFDVGNTTKNALISYKVLKLSPLECGEKDGYSNGNGSLMRIHPVCLYLYGRKLPTRNKIKIIEEVSSLTHAHERSKIGCGIYAFVLWELLNSPEKESIKKGLEKAKKFYQERDEINIYHHLFTADFKDKPKHLIKSSGYIVHTLESAIWCLYNSDNYTDCVLKAVNLGEDTDTVGAIAGGLAGALYGLNGIPCNWLKQLLKRDYIEQLCEKTYVG
jgi:ADP-ribosylglycohydrolase